jgi:PhnB protein
MTVQPIPEGFHSVTPCIAVDGGVEALAFYERAFGAKVRLRLVVGGKLMHSEVQIGDSIVCVNDAFPEMGSAAPEADAPQPVALMIYCEDAAALQERAVAAGATLVNKVADQFHGDRAGSIKDPYGHRWLLATHTEDLTEAELQRRTDEAMSGAR